MPDKLSFAAAAVKADVVRATVEAALADVDRVLRLNNGWERTYRGVTTLTLDPNTLTKLYKVIEAGRSLNEFAEQQSRSGKGKPVSDGKVCASPNFLRELRALAREGPHIASSVGTSGAFPPPPTPAPGTVTILSLREHTAIKATKTALPKRSPAAPNAVRQVKVPARKMPARPRQTFTTQVPNIRPDEVGGASRVAGRGGRGKVNASGRNAAVRASRRAGVDVVAENGDGVACESDCGIPLAKLLP